MQDTDFKWFIENYNSLYSEYGVSYLAIKDKRVLGSYPSPALAVSETIKKETLGTFIVQFCNGEESGYTNYIASFNFIN